MSKQTTIVNLIENPEAISIALNMKNLPKGACREVCPYCCKVSEHGKRGIYMYPCAECMDKILMFADYVVALEGLQFADNNELASMFKEGWLGNQRRMNAVWDFVTQNAISPAVRGAFGKGAPAPAEINDGGKYTEYPRPVKAERSVGNPFLKSSPRLEQDYVYVAVGECCQYNRDHYIIEQGEWGLRTWGKEHFYTKEELSNEADRKDAQGSGDTKAFP